MQKYSITIGKPHFHLAIFIAGSLYLFYTTVVLLCIARRIYNYGNVEAENVVLSDTFNPAPTNITVSRDGTVLIGTDYTYIDGTLRVPATDSVNITVPAATFVRDPETCIVSVEPGVVEYVIRGTI